MYEGRRFQSQLQKKLYLALINKTQEELDGENRKKIGKEASIIKFIRDKSNKKSVNFYKETYGETSNEPHYYEPELRFIDEKTVFRTAIKPESAIHTN